MSRIVSKVRKGELTKQKDIGVWDFFHVMMWICQNIVTVSYNCSCTGRFWKIGELV